MPYSWFVVSISDDFRSCVCTTAQKTTPKKTTPSAQSGYGSSGYGTTPTQQPAQNSAYGNNNQQQQSNQPQANIPIVVVKSTEMQH
jgi:hypothetical protein